MARRKEYILLIALIIGLGLFLWQEKTDQVHYQLPQLEPVSSSQISKITLTRDQDRVVLIQKDEGWILQSGGFPAHSGQVDKILQVVSDLQLSALVSKSQHYARYNLDPENAIQVAAWDGDQLLRRVVVGKAASTYQNTYVRLPDDPAVYLAQSNLRSAVDQDGPSLRDKTVLTFDQTRITKIQLQTPERELTLQAKDESQADTDGGNQASSGAGNQIWLDAKGQEVESSQVTALLNLLSGLKCAAYIEDRDKSVFQSPQYRIAVHGQATHRLDLFPQAEVSAEQGTAAVSTDNDFPFVLSTYNSNQVTKKMKTLTGERRTDSESNATSPSQTAQSGSLSQ